MTERIGSVWRVPDHHPRGAFPPRLGVRPRGCFRSLAACLVFFSGSVAAESRATQVFRCELPTGVVAFSDRYCGDDAQPVFLHAPPSRGLSLVSDGDFSAVARGNAERARKRRDGRLRQQQGALAASHRAAVSALQTRLADLPDNAFKTSTARRLQEQIDSLEAEYNDRRRRLLERHRARSAQ